MAGIMAGRDCRRDIGATDTNRACDRTRGWYARSIMSLTRLGGTRGYVEDPSSFDSMWLILEAMVTRAHSNCARRSASSASLAAWAADGFRLDGGAFLRGVFLRGAFGISTGGGGTFFFQLFRDSSAHGRCFLERGS